MGSLKLVKNESKYWEFIRELRNMDGVRQGFIYQNQITEAEQLNYMKSHNDYYWICLSNNQPAGYVGVIEDDIRVATSPEYQQQGIGKFMIDELKKICPTAYAKIKIKNEASIRLFEKCGFKKKYFILEKEI